MTFGAHSSVSKLRRVQLVPPGIHTSREHEQAGWTTFSQTERTRQFQNYANLLRSRGVQVEITETAENPDAIYSYDNCMITKKGAILFRSKKRNRTLEINPCRKALQKIDLPILAEIDAPDLIDGGDVFWLDGSTLAAGLSWRTNVGAIESLSEIMGLMGVSVHAYDLPNCQGKDYCLHLMSLISPLTENMAVVSIEQLPVRLIQDLESRGITLIPSPMEEFETLGTNVLALGGGEVLSLAGNWVTAQKMRDAGLTVHEFHGPDLCLAGSGGPTCLTRIIHRD